MSQFMIGEFADLCGLSKDTLRYYDKAGVLLPSGKTTSGYRFYTEYDLLRLMQLRTLQGLDTSLQDCLKIQTLPTLSLRLAQSISSLDAQIAGLTALRSRIQDLQSEISTCTEQCGICRRSCTIPTYSIYFSSEKLNRQSSHTISVWMQHMPYAHTAFCLPEGLLPGHEAHPLMGVGILKSYVHRHNLPHEGASCYPKSQAVRCVLKMRDPLHPTEAEFAPMINYMAENNLHSAGSWNYRPRFIDQQGDDGKPVYYVGACIRIE